MNKELKGKRALVTGASSGLGDAFARKLAAAGADLVVAARREDRLASLAKELSEKHGVKVDVIAIDLSDPASPKQLFEKAGKIDILVNNAGGGIHGRFVEIPWEKTARQIQLNITSLTELTWLFARDMAERGEGYVLNVSSIGAYTPSPTYATYSAGKAFVRDFSEAIAYELAGKGVRVCSLCPGGTETEFHQAAGHELPKLFRATFMTADRCADIGLSALFAGRRNIISGFSNNLSMFLMRLFPRRMMVKVAALSMGEPKEPTRGAS